MIGEICLGVIHVTTRPGVDAVGSGPAGTLWVFDRPGCECGAARWDGPSISARLHNGRFVLDGHAGLVADLSWALGTPTGRAVPGWRIRQLDLLREAGMVVGEWPTYGAYGRDTGRWWRADSPLQDRLSLQLRRAQQGNGCTLCQRNQAGLGTLVLTDDTAAVPEAVVSHLEHLDRQRRNIYAAGNTLRLWEEAGVMAQPLRRHRGAAVSVVDLRPLPQGVGQWVGLLGSGTVCVSDRHIFDVPEVLWAVMAGLTGAGWYGWRRAAFLRRHTYPGRWGGRVGVRHRETLEQLVAAHTLRAERPAALAGTLW